MTEQHTHSPSSGGRTGSNPPTLIITLIVVALVFNVFIPPDNPLFGDRYSIQTAARRGDIERVRGMLRRDPGLVNAPSQFGGETALVAASLRGHKAVVELLLANGANVHLQGRWQGTALHAAARDYRKVTSELLLNHGADVKATDSRGWTPLHYAAANGSKAVVELLINKGADVNARAPHEVTPLQLATAKNDKDATAVSLIGSSGTAATTLNEPMTNRSAVNSVIKARREVVELLLAKGADPNVMNEDNKTPLWLAVRMGDQRIVETLLLYGADVGQSPPAVEPLLRTAIKSGALHIAEILLQKGAAVDVFSAAGLGATNILSSLLERDISLVNTNDLYEWSPLHWAAYSGQQTAVALLLKHKANVNVLNREQLTPLRLAVQRGRAEVVEQLLDGGADAHSESTSDMGLLQFAAYTGQKKILEILLAHSVADRELDRQGKSALECALEGGNIELAEWLVNKGAKMNVHTAAALGKTDELAALLRTEPSLVNRPNHAHDTPLNWASRCGHVRSVELLLSRDADPNIPGERRMTPLKWAALGGHKDIATMLIAHGADVNCKRSWFTVEHRPETPLHLAVMRGQGEVAELLIENGADVNAKSRDGKTPLHHAAANGLKRLVELLISKGADPNIRDNDDQTPIYWAVRYGHDDVANLLIRNVGGEG